MALTAFAAALVVASSGPRLPEAPEAGLAVRGVLESKTYSWKVLLAGLCKLGLRLNISRILFRPRSFFVLEIDPTELALSRQSFEGLLIMLFDSFKDAQGAS